MAVLMESSDQSCIDSALRKTKRPPRRVAVIIGASPGLAVVLLVLAPVDEIAKRCG